MWSIRPFLLLLLLVVPPVHAILWRRLKLKYEVWGSDQSNSVSGATGRGVDGSYIWVWRSEDIRRQIRSSARRFGAPAFTAQPVGCDGNNRPGDGPCDVKVVFPATLQEHDENGATGANLGDYLYGRLHGMLPDPQNRYLNVNLFGPGNGFVGIIDGSTKEAVAMFRVTATSAGQRVHMSFWNADGSAILIANLNGKILERIDISRDERGRITNVVFNQSAGLAVGKGITVTTKARVYLGLNAQGNSMVGAVAGTYDDADLLDYTPAGRCRENGCDDGASDGSAGGRPNNVIICPIVSSTNKGYITMGGGGLLVADTTQTPMQIIGEYGQQVVNGAGCGGVESGTDMWLNAGISASGAGSDQSTFTVYKIDDKAFPAAENMPTPVIAFKDSSNTATIGNIDVGAPTSDVSGQLPGTTTRRDSHGMAATQDGRFMHTVDRIQNVVEVIDTKTLARSTYDLTSHDGQSGRGDGVCAAMSVTDDPGLPRNDPAPDLLEATPDGRFLVVALRGPVPVSVTHSAQGSCPGVGIIQLLPGWPFNGYFRLGKSGRLATVLRTTNTLDTTPVDAPGGHPYTGAEHSDVHGASVRVRVEDERFRWW